MSQLVISDLDFCETEFTGQSEVKGGALVAIDVGIANRVKVNLSAVAVGVAVGVAVFVGGNAIANVNVGVQS